MKLKNKKSGEVVELVGLHFHNGRSFFELEDGNGTFKREITTLADFNENWEDYKLTEPLIENKTIRKAVRLWATINGLTEVRYNKINDCIHWPYSTDTSVCISFEDVRIFEKLEHMEIYTIAELCGENEE